MLISPKTGRVFGTVRHDVFDARDHVSTPPLAIQPPVKLHFNLKFPFFHKGVSAAAVRFDSVDHEPTCGPVKNQENEGACTGFAWSGGREFLFRTYPQFEKNKSIDPEHAIFSPQFIYHQERKREGTIAVDNGAQPRTGAIVLNQLGVCLEKSFPYQAGDILRAPTEAQLAEALTFISGAYHRIIGGVEDMKSVLKSGYVFTMAIQIYESFESDYTKRTGLVEMPHLKETCYGAHEILVIGFDDKRQAFKVRNSWGDQWGDNGNFWLPYAFVSAPDLTWDPWIQHLGPSWK